MSVIDKESTENPTNANAVVPVQVVGREHVAVDVVALELCPTDGSQLPPWSPGAHVDLVLPSGLTRQYSLCGNPSRLDTYHIAVHRVANGRGGSMEVHEHLLPGALVGIRPPRNRFPLVNAEKYVFVAGGIGITPISAMVREIEARGLPWRLVYGGRSLDRMAFTDDLTALGSDRVELVPQDDAGFPDLRAVVRDAPTGAAVYCCGPAPMLAAIEHEVSATRDDIELRIERFVAPDEPQGERQAFELELRRSGVTVTVPADRSILDVVIDAIGDVEFSCEQGICGACETKVLAGRPEHHDELLSPEERAEGATMMICVGRSKTPRLVLDL
ncbi:PDR/VanB family oxidoreductase [Rhodococcus sp. ACS1]|uniref:PDR/VanB family oxidoreductase n=1 Tax=Rhodococcus sp. ACS1 TaxID=2028570 RepID=UPI00211BE254|nr:PDR/VanB family oxidoreductase [Rhodococcus sp. ACS1]